MFLCMTLMTLGLNWNLLVFSGGESCLVIPGLMDQSLVLPHDPQQTFIGAFKLRMLKHAG